MTCLLLAGPAIAGEDYTFIQKLFMADAIVHVAMTFDRPIPERWPNKACDRLKWAFPHALVERASRTAKVKEVLRGPHDGKLPATFGSTVDDCWWWEVHKRGSAELVLFLKKEPGGWREIRGVEGPEPASPETLAAVRRIVRWMAKPRDARIAVARKEIRSRTEPYVSAAIATLCLDAPDVAVDVVRRAHPPESITGDAAARDGWCQDLRAAYSMQGIDFRSR
jgi:hypothetical protein